MEMNLMRRERMTTRMMTTMKTMTHSMGRRKVGWGRTRHCRVIAGMRWIKRKKTKRI